MIKKKTRRSKLNLEKKKIDNLTFGSWGIKALATSEITKEQVENSRRIISRNFLKRGFYWFRLNFSRPLYKRATGMRMGKGKGKVHKMVAPITQGQIFLEIEIPASNKTKSILTKVIKKLPFPAKIVHN